MIRIMANQPNVLLICTDHWSASLLGSAGHPSILTPTLDALARSGVRFSNAYSECPVCIPGRRCLMTGTTPRTHGMRTNKGNVKMPDPAQIPTVAQTFRNAGYQAYAVGKLHVYPQRDRIGFDDVILDEEGRLQNGVIDDHEMFLADHGFAGQQFAHGMSNNTYDTRPWHLPEAMHPTHWATHQMARVIQRRDPLRPAFWYLSYRHPHPPLTPIKDYLDMYADVEIPEPLIGDWAQEIEKMPFACRANATHHEDLTPRQITLAMRAFYAQCTYIDHQLRYVIGTLSEAGILNNTILCFTADHGDQLGQHRLWNKTRMYEGSNNVPMILLGPSGDPRVPIGLVDDRVVGLADVMPTLLDLAGVDIPKSVDGISMVGPKKHDYFYGENADGPAATRMIHDGRYKLIYYPAGNRFQLFDLDHDPNEMNDVAAVPEQRQHMQQMTQLLIGELYGPDKEWIKDGKLVGMPEPERKSVDGRSLDHQRGSHFPQPPGKE